MAYTNRYDNFTANNAAKTVPFLTIPVKTTDKYAVYTIGQSRLDKISASFYAGDPTYGWLIMIANPEFDKEVNITDGAMLRIPFPLEQSKTDYNDAITLYKRLYGE